MSCFSVNMGRCYHHITPWTQCHFLENTHPCKQSLQHPLVENAVQLVKINPYSLSAHPPNFHSALMQWWVKKVRSGETSRWCLGFQQSQHCSVLLQVPCFPVQGQHSACRLESNYWHSVAAAAGRTGIAMGHFVASGICKGNHGMGLPLRPWKRHPWGSLVLFDTLCCCITAYLFLKNNSSISFSLPLSSSTGNLVWSVYPDLRKEKGDVHP